ncbi:hypothetical protein H318_14743 [Enterococcus durans IPLA 655]|uniref:Hachiman antiphage defense system protein HamA n=1 Tax=Enterococcus durans TaxID=53345 RepID=UPI0003286547|nr:Hachiman antiphage defense system protein HamA [Enterococcus durans]EMS74333.1 hypothetical protein H318_14743 [Enterococcus durans IPLA 655]
MTFPKFIEYFIREENVVTNQGKDISIIKIDINNDEDVLKQWAIHLRNHYCSLEELDELREGPGLSRLEFLRDMKFPNPTLGLGSATMSGDFSEILIADYIEYILNYIVPRVRYRQKANRNTSTQGSDLIGYKVESIETNSINDELLIVEVKARNSESNPEATLQNAVDHSEKDIVRIAESLNASYRMLKNYNEYEGMRLVRRFQNPTDRPHKRTFAAASVHSDTSFSVDLLKQVDISKHPEDVKLIAIHSPNFLTFIKEMYVRAANVD